MSAAVLAERYLDFLSFGSFDVSRDGRTVAFAASITGSPELWIADSSWMWPRRMTFGGQTISDVQFDREGSHVYFISDNDGDEIFSIYRLAVTGGEPDLVLGGDGNRYYGPMFAGPNRLMYCTDRDDTSFVAPYVRDLVTGKDTPLGEAGVSTVISDHDPLGDRFLIVAVDDNTRQRLILKHPDSGSRKEISGAAASCLGGVFGPDSSSVLFAAAVDSDRYQMYSCQLASGTVSPLFDIEGDIGTYEISPDRRFLAVSVDHGLESELCVYDLQTMQRLPLHVPGTEFAQPLFRGRSLFMLAGSPAAPMRICRVDLTTGQFDQLTDALVGGLCEQSMVMPREVTYRAADGLAILSLLYEAAPRTPDTRPPLVVWLHSGPHLVERKNYRGMFQYLVARGYSVFCPNFRGSTGFGLDFQRRAHRDWGGGPCRDVLDGMDWLVNEGICDRDNIAVMGGSYGGYLALLIAARYPTLPRAAVDFFGPSDLVSFASTVPEHWKPMIRETIGDPELDFELLREQSPITYMDCLSCPTFIVQGRQDTRVVPAESQRVVDRLRARGVPVEYLLLDDEGHGFSKTANVVRVMAAIGDFLDRVMRR